MNELSFLLDILDLKDEKRTGWELRNIEDPESVADHSWSTAFLTLFYGMKEESLDLDRSIKIAIVHDMAEAETGDIATRAQDKEPELSKQEKSDLEKQFFKKIPEQDGEILKLWKEYESKETREAKFVNDMDKIDLCLQALKYEKQKRYDPDEENENFQKYDNLNEFFATTESRLKTSTGMEMFEEIREKYRQTKQ